MFWAERLAAAGAEGSVVSLIASYSRLSDTRLPRGQGGGGTYDINIANLVEPESISVRGSEHKVPLLKMFIDRPRRMLQLLQDPKLH